MLYVVISEGLLDLKPGSRSSQGLHRTPRSIRASSHCCFIWQHCCSCCADNGSWLEEGNQPPCSWCMFCYHFQCCELSCSFTCAITTRWTFITRILIIRTSLSCFPFSCSLSSDQRITSDIEAVTTYLASFGVLFFTTTAQVGFVFLSTVRETFIMSFLIMRFLRLSFPLSSVCFWCNFPWCPSWLPVSDASCFIKMKWKVRVCLFIASAKV